MSLISFVYLLAGLLYIFCQTRWTTAEDTNLPHLSKKIQIEKLRFRKQSLCSDLLMINIQLLVSQY